MRLIEYINFELANKLDCSDVCGERLQVDPTTKSVGSLAAELMLLTRE